MSRLGADRASDLPDAKTRLVLSRFSAGPSAKRLLDVEAAGGIEAWFEQQLTPKHIPDRAADALWSWYPSLGSTPVERWRAHQAGTLNSFVLSMNLASWLMMRRLVSRRAVEEVMVDFWSNLLHVASPCPNVWLWRVEYEEVVRKHALGRFEDMLRATIPHPAMGLYLNNVESTATAMNENLGRELLECFTVGVGQFAEHDVLGSVRILTGFHVDVGGTWEPSYVPEDHWVGRIKVLGFTSANASQDGRPVLNKYLGYLARHPTTARRLCERLAVRFVSDTPSQDLVEKLAAVYLESDTDIRPVLRALVASDEFRASAMRKVKTPVEGTIATWNALAVEVAPPHGADDAANIVPILPVSVVTPAPQAAVLLHGARVVVVRGDPHPGVELANLERYQAGCGVPLTELAVGVGAPAPEGACGSHAAGVFPGGDQAGPGGRDSRWLRPRRGRARHQRWCDDRRQAYDKRQAPAAR